MDHARFCRGLQGCSRDKQRNNWRCAETPPKGGRIVRGEIVPGRTPPPLCIIVSSTLPVFTSPPQPATWQGPEGERRPTAVVLQRVLHPPGAPHPLVLFGLGAGDRGTGATAAKEAASLAPAAPVTPPRRSRSLGSDPTVRRGAEGHDLTPRVCPHRAKGLWRREAAVDCVMIRASRKQSVSEFLVLACKWGMGC